MATTTDPLTDSISIGGRKEEILTVAEAAAFLRIGRNQLYDAIGRGEVPHRRVGKSIRLSRTALIEWFSWSTQRAVKEP